MVLGLSRATACGMVQEQGSTLCLLSGKLHSILDQQGSPLLSGKLHSILDQQGSPVSFIKWRTVDFKHMQEDDSERESHVPARD